MHNQEKRCCTDCGDDADDDGDQQQSTHGLEIGCAFGEDGGVVIHGADCRRLGALKRIRVDLWRARVTAQSHAMVFTRKKSLNARAHYPKCQSRAA